MKRINLLPLLVLSLSLLISLPTLAQPVSTPQASPKATLHQTVGLTEVTIVYHRPQVKEREIWGKLVAYNEGTPMPWRAGANDNTTISFSSDVLVEGKELAAGTYGIHMIPSENEVTIIFSSNHTSWGSYSYNADEDVLRVKVKPESCGHHELLTYDFIAYNPQKAEATCALSWADRRVPFRIGMVDMHKEILADINNQLRHLNGFSWQGWNSAARYCLANNVELEQGLKWADRSIAGGWGSQANFTTLSTKAQILTKLERAEEAEKTMDKAMTMATNVELNAYGYQLLQGGDHDGAIAAFKLNTEQNPNDPNVWDSLGEGYATRMGEGDKKAAIKAFKKSLSLNPPENVKSNSMKHLKKLGVKVTDKTSK